MSKRALSPHGSPRVYPRVFLWFPVRAVEALPQARVSVDLAPTNRPHYGEYVVGAYLRLCEKCDVVDYNVRPPQSGLSGLAEI